MTGTIFLLIAMSLSVVSGSHRILGGVSRVISATRFEIRTDN